MNLRYLNYAAPQNSNAFKLDFDNYWPLEILDLDIWLEEQEASVSSFSNKARKELLYNKLKQKLDSLRHEELAQNYNRIRIVC